MRNKRIWVSILLMLFTNILCLPLWTECGYSDFVRTLFTKEARLDLLYFGKITSAEPFQYKASPKPFLASWSYGVDVHRANLCLRAGGQWQGLSLQIKAQRDGKITMLFRGPGVPDEYGGFHSVLTDWRNVQINGKTILPKSEVFSFTRPFSKEISVKKGDLLHVEAGFRRHHFSIRDFTWLSSGNLWFLITGNLLIFSLIYRILSYFAEHREHLRLGDTLLVVIFFPCLFVPMTNISDGVKSDRENRMLAVKPKLKDFFRRNTYTGGYEKYFNDHFAGRVSLIKLHDAIQNKLNKIIRAKKALYIKERGWMFLTPFVSNCNWQSGMIRSAVHHLAQLNEFCSQNNIKFYVLETPRKESIYKEIIMDEYGFDNKRFIKVSQMQETIRNEARKRNIPWIYPYKELCDAAKKDLVFFKWSWHWTDWGAFVGYRELMKEVKKSFPDIPIVSLDDCGKSQSWLIRDTWAREYTTGYFYPFFNMSSAPHNRTLYNYYDHKDCDKVMLKVERYIKDFAYPEGKHKIMLMGTSQADNLLQFLPFSAAQITQIRLNKRPIEAKEQFKILKLYRKDILDFKPDILVLSISSDNLPQLLDLCSTK